MGYVGDMLAFFFLFACDLEPPVDVEPGEPLVEDEAQISEHCEGSFSADAQDLTVAISAAPVDGLQVQTPCVEVPPHVNRYHCQFGTYTGPDVGIVSMVQFYSEHSHHNQLMVVREDEGHEDGVLYDCTDWGDIRDYEPMMADAGSVDGRNVIDMPEGFAFKLESGTRYLLETHYINPGTSPIAVNDGINLGLVSASEVTDWVASFHFDAPVKIPAGSEHTACVVCDVEHDVGVLSMVGHMHEWGSRFTVDLTRDGEKNRIYEVPEWSSEWTDDPREIIDSFEAGTYGFLAGDQLKSCCTWVNDTEEQLRYPDEMCTFIGVAHPLDAPWKCN
jgi:hypothetical protein